MFSQHDADCEALEDERETEPEPERPDVRVENHGSLIRLVPSTPDATNWLRQNTDSDATWFSGLCCEPRYAEAIVAGLIDDGFTVK
jgi:hypothetical protein